MVHPDPDVFELTPRSRFDIPRVVVVKEGSALFQVIFVVLALGFSVGGIGTLLGVRFYLDIMEKVGVGRTLGAVVALLEIAAAAALLMGLRFPALGAVAAGGLVLLMAGAVVFHIRSKDYRGVVAPTLLGLTSALAVVTTLPHL
jgi:hypothetical protein